MMRIAVIGTVNVGHPAGLFLHSAGRIDSGVSGVIHPNKVYDTPLKVVEQCVQLVVAQRGGCAL